MKHLQLSEKSDADFSGIKASETDYEVLYDEDIEVRKPDGSLLCVLLKKSISKEALSTAWAALKDEHMWTNNRGTASGEKMIMKNKQMVTEESVDSGIVGFFERTPRFPYCRACAWNLQNPKSWQMLFPMVKEVDDLFKKHAGERYEKQKRVAEKTHPDFLIPGSYFSTLTVNKNFRTAYHKDAGNLPDGISCMTVIRKGKWTGANLVFPAYRIAVKLDGFDTIIFDPHEFHGNTPLHKLTDDAVRCSVVYYFRDKIQECGSAQEEFDRVKNRKQGEQLHSTILRKKEQHESGS